MIKLLQFKKYNKGMVGKRTEYSKKFREIGLDFRNDKIGEICENGN